MARIDERRGGDVQPVQKDIQEEERQQVDKQRNGQDKHKGVENTRFHPVRLSGSVKLCENDAASHAKAQYDGGQQDHQRIGGADGGQRVSSDGFAHNQGVGDIIQLLQQVPRNHRQTEQQQGFSDMSGG